MIIKSGLIRNQSASHRLERRILNIFEAGGYDGFIFDIEDPSLLYQDSTRTIPVTAVGQPIGSITDESYNANHAIQATSPARPILQVNSNGKYVARFDGVDDGLTCATGGGGTTGFLFCVSLKSYIGSGGIFILFDDRAASNTGYIVFINAAVSGNRTISLLAGTGTSYNVKTSTFSITNGTDNLLTLWDDGLNLNVQIDGGVIESKPRLSVSPGAGYSICKANVIGPGFSSVDLYRGVYIKNSNLSLSDITTIQQWVKLGAGL